METKERELIKKVRAMRSAQKEYFRTRSPYTLSECRQLEYDVDKLISEISAKEGNKTEQPVQLNLFGNEQG